MPSSTLKQFWKVWFYIRAVKMPSRLSASNRGFLILTAKTRDQVNKLVGMIQAWGEAWMMRRSGNLRRL